MESTTKVPQKGIASIAAKGAILMIRVMVGLIACGALGLLAGLMVSMFTGISPTDDWNAFQSARILAVQVGSIFGGATGLVIAVLPKSVRDGYKLP